MTQNNEIMDAAKYYVVVESLKTAAKLFSGLVSEDPILNLTIEIGVVMKTGVGGGKIATVGLEGQVEFSEEITFSFLNKNKGLAQIERFIDLLEKPQKNTPNKTPVRQEKPQDLAYTLNRVAGWFQDLGTGHIDRSLAGSANVIKDFFQGLFRIQQPRPKNNLNVFMADLEKKISSGYTEKKKLFLGSLIEDARRSIGLKVSHKIKYKGTILFTGGLSLPWLSSTVSGGLTYGIGVEFNPA